VAARLIPPVAMVSARLSWMSVEVIIVVIVTTSSSGRE
jgi:hypothetical protein